MIINKLKYRINDTIKYIKFNKDITILTGLNGSGKTLVINNLTNIIDAIKSNYNLEIVKNINYIGSIKKAKIEVFNKVGFHLVGLSGGENKIRRLEKIKNKDLILIDDIEQHLHISYQMKILDILQSNNPNSQIIVTTHSPSIINGNWDNVIDLTKL